jgi:HlyD family secretion protein
MVIAVIVIAVLAGLWYGFRPRPEPVEAGEARRKTMRVTVDEEGQTRVINRFVVSSPVAGYARRVSLDVGDTVKKGELLVVIEPRRSEALDPRSRATAQARAASAEAALKSAEDTARSAGVAAEFAESEFERNKKLYNEGYLSAADFDRLGKASERAGADRRAADHAVEVARFELEAARSALGFSGTGDVAGSAVSVLAPVSGRVLKLHKESEGAVAEGAPLVDIGNARSLEVEVDLLSSDAVKVTPGTRVIFERWGGDKPLEGRVRTIEPAGFTKISALGVEEQRVLVISDIVSPAQEWEKLGDGYRVEASFVIWEGAGALTAPMSALFRHGDGGSLWAAFVIEDGTARLREVKPGHLSGLEAEILSGLNEGERVIIHPSDDIEDGVRVRVR